MLGGRGAARAASLCVQSESINLRQPRISRLFSTENKAQATNGSGCGTVFNDTRGLPREERGPEAPPLRRHSFILFAQTEAEAPTVAGPGASLCSRPSSPSLALEGR